jgi:hypothetical protein
MVNKSAYIYICVCVCVCTHVFLSFNVTYIGDLLISKLHNNFESKLNTNSTKNKTRIIFFYVHMYIH